MADDTKDGRKPSDTIEAPHGQAPSDKPALEPYWGKPAVRNLRGDDGNVGIIRSPVRAIVLPDRQRVSLPPVAIWRDHHAVDIAMSCVKTPAGK